MAVPNYQKIMLPFLKVLADEKPHKLQEIKDILVDELELSLFH